MAAAREEDATTFEKTTTQKKYFSNADLGLARAPSAFAVFCQLERQKAKPPGKRRRVTGKTAVYSKESVLLKWRSLSPGQKWALGGKISAEKAASNKASRGAALGTARGPEDEATHETHNATSNKPGDVAEWGTLSLMVGESLGHGSYGEVYAARDAHTKECFALKVAKQDTSAESLQDLGHEWDVLKTLSHPNIVSAYGIVVCDKDRPMNIGILMEMADGKLSTWLQSKPLEPKGCSVPDVLQRWRLSLQVACGLSHMHTRTWPKISLSLALK
jgi:hypothetical protein